jgi:Family of unknown function (DUF6152)
MKISKLSIAAAALAVVAIGATAQQAAAHHAFAAEFDATAPVLLRGKVTRIEWTNPHAWVHLTDEASSKAWMVEGGTPNTLFRNGINRDSLKVGTEIIVRGYQSKDRLCTPECRANGRDVTLSNGQKVFMGSSGTGAPKDGADATEK